MSAQRQKEKGRPIRLVVLDLLEDLRCPAYSRELALLSQAQYGRRIAPTRFGSLGTDERNAFMHGRPQPVWLAHLLTYDRAEPIKRLWARSDWPLEERIFAPTTGRIQHLRITKRLCELASNDIAAAEPEMLKIIAADHARDLPGIKFKRGEFPLEEWTSIASTLLEELEPRDRESRKASAKRLASMSEFHLLFGRPEEIAGVEPLEQRA